MRIAIGGEQSWAQKEPCPRNMNSKKPLAARTGTATPLEIPTILIYFTVPIRPSALPYLLANTQGGRVSMEYLDYRGTCSTGPETFLTKTEPW